jgi:hypothetical protein
MNEQFAFLTSNRFWALVLGAVAYYLQQKGIFGESEMLLVATITAGFIGIKTLDRASEKLGPQPPVVTLNELPDMPIQRPMQPMQRNRRV